MTYDELLIKHDNEVTVYEHNLQENPIIKKAGGKGFYCSGTILIQEGLTDREKRCILAEELGHHYTSYGNILNLNDYESKKQELRARRWAAKQLIKYEDFEKAISMYDNVYQIAEELDVLPDVVHMFYLQLQTEMNMTPWESIDDTLIRCMSYDF